MEERHIVAVDLGTSKIALTVAKVHGDDVQIVYHSECPSSNGIKYSSIFNTKKVEEPLRKLITDAEKSLDIKITQVVVGLPKYKVSQETATKQIARSNPDESITEEEIRNIKDSALNDYPLTDPEREIIFGAVAESYSAGEEFQIVESEIIGVPCAELEANFKVFIGQKTPVKKIDVVFNNLGIGVARKYFTAESLARTVLSHTDMENGVALIDFGAGCTSLSVYYGNIMRHYASIPFGGKSVTMDIKNESSISESLAESIKLAYGSCMPDKSSYLSDKTIRIHGNGDFPDTDLPVKYLSEIITSRMKEIIDAILYEIQESGCADNLRSGLVITGGGAELMDCAQYITEVSGYKVRKGYPFSRLFSSDCSGTGELGAAVSIGLILTAKNEKRLNCAIPSDFSSAAVNTGIVRDETGRTEDTGYRQPENRPSEDRQAEDRLPENKELGTDSESVPEKAYGTTGNTLFPGIGETSGARTGGKPPKAARPNPLGKWFKKTLDKTKEVANDFSATLFNDEENKDI